MIAYICFWALVFSAQWTITVLKSLPLKYKGKANFILLLFSTCILYIIVMNMVISDHIIIRCIVAPIVEILGMFLCVVVFTKNQLFFNMIIADILFAIANTLTVLIVMFFPKVLYIIQVIDIEYFYKHIDYAVISGVTACLSIFLVSSVYARIFKRAYKGSQVWWVVAYILYAGYNIIRHVFLSEFNSESYYIVIAVLSIVAAFIMFLCMTYLYNNMERKRIEREQHQIKAMLDKIYDHYELMVRENRELRDLKHDMNKQLEIARRLSEKAGTSKAAREYLLELITEQSSYIGIPYSGNIDVDTILAMCFQQAQKRSIMLEMVVQPLDEIAMETTELIGLLSAVTDEIMDKCVIGTATPWIRISIRRRGKNTLFQIEYSVRKKWYALKRVISSLFFREPGNLKSDYIIKSVVEKYQAGYINAEDEEKGMIAIMF